MSLYITPTDLATYMEKPIDTANAELLIAGASSMVETYLGWDVASGSVTERLDTLGGSLLLLSTLRLNSVTSVTDASGNMASGYSWSDKGMLHTQDHVIEWWNTHRERVYTGWNSGFGAYTVVYDSGYATIPADIQLVVMSVISRTISVPPGTQQQSSTVGGRTEAARYFNITGIELMAAEQAILSRYALPARVN